MHGQIFSKDYISLMKKIWMLGLLAIGCISLVAIVVASFQKLGGSNAPRLMAVTQDAFGGPFSLTGHTGKTITEKTYAGQYKLMYFGFTFCPAICPTELSKMTAALNVLGEDAKKIQPIFVTVDPERDTVQKMKSYVELFHPSLVGLTGTPDQISSMLKSYKIFAAKVDDPNLTEYTMDHSSFIYLMAPDGRLLHIFKIGDNADVMATTIRAWLEKENENNAKIPM